MLIADVERYIVLRQTLGFQLHRISRRLRAFAQFATEKGDTHVRASTALEWAAAGPSLRSRQDRLRDVVRLGRFLCAEDAAHEVPPARVFHVPKRRPLPYIYTPEEVAQILEIAGQLRLQRSSRLRRQTFVMLFGLIAATGLRVSEALNLKLDDILPDGILRIARTKFGKSRLVPLHATVVDALDRYLDARRRVTGTDNYVFLSAGNRRLSASMANYTFRRVLRLANIASGRARAPRIHDLRHTFATRALEQCAPHRKAVAQHFVALATYMGHTTMVNTYWYLQATPELMTDIAAAAEALVAEEVA